ncbi:AraC family transcriptional regulator [Flavobacterium sp. J27]|uniref:helix-turn-helix domain-containing protein n=1 Tax=Flavobacterium sp. J27 TaxID=2060419 RepID=UPI00102F6005|nr:helix-turn-helix domain-containing protein [Flavobacterium sp. J27]
MKSFLLLPFLFVLHFSHGQIKDHDLKKKSLKEIVSLFFDSNTDTLIKQKCAEELLERGKKNKNDNEIAYSYFLKEKMHHGKLALSFNDSTYKYFVKTGNTTYILGTLLNKADILNYELDKKIDALKLYLEIYNNPENENDILKIDILQKIATIKSEDLGKFEESIILYKKVSDYYRANQDSKSFDGKERYYWSLFALASNYKDLHQLDSSSYYNRLGYKLTKKNHYECYNSLFILNQAAVEVENKNFQKSIDSINKTINILQKCDLQGNLAAAYYYKGRNYEGMNNPYLAATNYIKMDSLFTNPNILNPKFISGYKYLIEYYKKKEDLQKQLQYINRFVTIDSILQTKNNSYKELLKNKYEIPQLLQEKEAIINSLDTKRSWLKKYLVITFLLILILIGFLTFQYKKQKKLKQRFEKIIEDLHLDKEKNIPVSNDKKEIKDIGMPLEVFDNILQKLKTFEKENIFLDSSLTLEKLATILETNSKYLSKVVNVNYKKTFPNYLNQLRINYIVKELKTNKLLKNYTINAISKEAGFNNSDSFSAAFEKTTGLKPSFFIKELNKVEEKQKS